MAQVGIEQPLDQLVLAETFTPDGMYRYSLHTPQAVAVAKRTPEGGWETTYAVLWHACDCPGFQNRQSCKHHDVARGLVQWWTEHKGAQA